MLTSVIWNWGPYYIDIVESVMDGTWESEQYWGGWPDGIVDLAPIAEFVPEEIRSTIEEEIARFKSGEGPSTPSSPAHRGPDRRDPRPRRAVHDRRRTAQHGLVRRGRRGRDSQLDEECQGDR